MFMEAIEKAGINGILAGGATAYLFGTKSTVANLFGNRQMSFPLFAGIVGAGGSLLGDATHLTIQEAIPVSQKFNDQASVVSGLAINGGLFAGMLYLYQPEILRDVGFLKAFGIGAGAEVAGSALYTYLKENEYF